MQPNYPTTAAPTRPFPVGPFQVTPRPIPGVVATRYLITFAGLTVGEQCSHPDTDDCARRAREAFAAGTIDGAVWRAVCAAVVARGGTPPPAVELAHAAPAFNNVKRRNPNDPEKMTRVCDDCEVEKPLTGFFKNGAGRRQAVCRSCVIRSAAARKARA
jgi:hypothetical protein